MSDVVDLTISSESDEAPPQATSQRRGERPGSRAAPAGDQDDVVIVENPEQEMGQQQQQQAQDLDSDQDLAVVGERGEVWNKNLPHTRNVCGEVPFVSGRSAANKAHCDKCYCYICDVPASECDANGTWGSGAMYSDHCNAHNGSEIFRSMKRKRQEEAARAVFDDDELDDILEFGGVRGFTSMMLGLGNRSRGPQRGEKPAKPVVERCSLRPIPDPAADSDMMLLARVEVPAEAQGCFTFPALKKRLAPTGFYLPVEPHASAGDRLYIDNLFDNHWNTTTHKYEPIYLKLQPLPLAGPPPEDPPTRRRQVTIIHYDGRAKPTTYGIDVPKEATVEEVMVAAAPLAGLDSRSEQFLAAAPSPSYLSVNFLGLQDKVTDNSQPLCLWRVAKPSDASANFPGHAVVFHRKATGRDYPKYEGVGLPTIVPLGKHLAQGGKAAERSVLERVLDALAPLGKDVDGAPAPAQAAKQLLEGGVRLYRSSTHGNSYGFTDPEAAFNSTRPYSRPLRYGDICFRDGRMYLSVDWAPSHLESFDVQAYRSPAVDASASPEAMQPTQDILKAHREWRVKEDRARQVPYSMLEELKAAHRCSEPGMHLPVHRGGSVEPIARVVLDLVPTSRGREEKRGKVVFSVYVWKGARGPAHREFFRAHDSWDSARSSRHHYSELGTNPLQWTMECVLWSDAAHQSMKERIKHWADRERDSERSIPGLMKALERGEMPAAQQPPGLTVTMRPYQLQSLQFMLDCERGEGGFRRLFWERVVTPEGRPFWWSTLLGRASLEVPAQAWGGWCAETMGLGKTIEMLGLILANPAPPLPTSGRQPDGSLRTADGLIKSRATLVVCAVSLVGQWMQEAKAKLNGSLKIHMYHGSDRIRDPVRLANHFDLVVTTYATLSADYGGRKGKSAENFPPLGAIQWHRLVLDEAHTVKNPAVGHSKACMALKADRRWMCTGTPINTDVGDLYGQFAVLGMAPFNNKTFFDTNIKSAFGNSVFHGNCPALYYTLGQCMVHHTKQQVLGGEEVLQLPPKTEELVAVSLTASEQEMYKMAHAASAALFAQYRALGPAHINKHLLQIMALLLPMRRVCSGGNLKKRDLEVSDPLFGEGAGVRRRRVSGSGPLAGGLAPTDHSLVAPEEECPVCMDSFELPSMTPCNHWFCRECILGVLAANAKCPLCRRSLTMAELRNGVTAAEADAEEAAAEAAAAAAAGAAAAEEGGEAPAAAPAEPTYVSESKLVALLKELRAMRRADPSAKALVFSQYTSTIEWLKTRLTEAGFGYRFISGSMPLKQRAKAINAFQNDPPTTVFLLSMRSGSVGINLTAASHVFLMEPALNPALEEQAIGRAWRMGQQRSVKVFKFYVKGSVEERIMQVVKQRTSAVAGGGDANSDAGHAGHDSDSDDSNYNWHHAHQRHARTNVRMQDLAGSISADRQQLRVSELEMLFQEPELGEPRAPQPESELEEEEEEEEAAGVSFFARRAADERPGTSAAHAALGRRRGGPSRGRGKRPRLARRMSAAAGSDAADSEAEGVREEDEESGGAGAAGARQRERLGRGARRARRMVNYAELSKGWVGDEEEEEAEAEEEGEEQQFPTKQPPQQAQQQEHEGGAGAEEQPQQQQQQDKGKQPKGSSKKRRRSEESSDEEWAAPDAEVDSVGMSEEDDSEYELEQEDEEEEDVVSMEEADSPEVKRRRRSAGKRASAPPAAVAARIVSGRTPSTEGMEHDGGEGEEPTAQQRGQEPRRATLTHIRSVQVTKRFIGADGRLVGGDEAAPSDKGAATPAAAQAGNAAPAPAATAPAAAANGAGSAPRPAMRGPMRGRRSVPFPAALQAEAAPAPAADT